jgi:hypothetical protein
MKKMICGFIFAETKSLKETKKFVERIKNCLYLVVQAMDSKEIFSAYIVPEEKRWWLEYPQLEPEKLGLKSAKTYIYKKVCYPERFSPGHPKKRTNIAPCKANCQICRLRCKYNCDGCPAINCK